MRIDFGLIWTSGTVWKWLKGSLDWFRIHTDWKGLKVVRIEFRIHSAWTSDFWEENLVSRLVWYLYGSVSLDSIGLNFKKTEGLKRIEKLASDWLGWILLDSKTDLGIIRKNFELVRSELEICRRKAPYMDSVLWEGVCCRMTWRRCGVAGGKVETWRSELPSHVPIPSYHSASDAEGARIDPLTPTSSLPFPSLPFLTRPTDALFCSVSRGPRATKSNQEGGTDRNGTVQQCHGATLQTPPMFLHC